ncbi:hypothetical protein SAMN04515678_102366 [Roseivivax sediminis]|uniref:Transposase n=2 Tax=Roseivivax sediminis TaxID=936889 RepID=A0A1I1UIB5_9RHOB|nr:hypothetical protein SAMN04515678_102366 [Roseivivax sediminis]
MGVFARIMEGLAAEQAECRTIMIPSRCLLRNQLPGSGRDLSQGAPHGLEPAPSKGGRGRLIGRSRGGVNTKLHTVTDREGRPVRLFVTAGQVSGYRGALALQSGFPQADWLIADRG